MTTNAHQQQIFDRLKNLTPGQFKEVVYQYKVHRSHLPENVSQVENAINLLTVAEQRPDTDYAELLTVITAVEAVQTVETKATTSACPFILPQRNLGNFTGRSEELTQLATLLIQQAEEKVSTIVGLSGIGGIGKSALACYFAETYRTHFPDGVIGLRVDGKDIAAVAREFARHVGIAPTEEDSATSIMQATFARRRMLLIFDNADAVDYADIRALLPGGLCAVIITTRDRELASFLDLQEAARVDLAELSAADALVLLGKYLSAERLAQEAAAVQDLMVSLGYLPLALKIAGHLLQRKSSKKIADYVAHLQAEKLEVRKDASLNLFACFALSLRELAPEEQQLFACLSVCARDGFAVATAAVAADVDADEAEDGLLALYQFSLLNQVESEDERYAFHALLYEFAQFQAQQLGVAEQAAQRHADYFIQQVKDAQHEELAGLATDMGDIVLAAGWLGQQQAVALDFVLKLQTLFQHYGHWHAADEVLQSFLKPAFARQDWEEIFHLQVQRAKYLALQSRLQQAETVLEETRALFSKMDSDSVRRRYEAMWLDKRGGLYLQQGRFTEAAEALRQSAAIEAEQGNARGQAKVLNSLGGILQRQGQFAEAVDVFQQSHALLIKFEDKRGQAMVLNSLGGVLQRLRRFDEAVDAFQQSQKISEKFNDERSLAMALNSLGGVLQRLGRFDEAVDAFQYSYELSVNLKDERGQAMVLNSLGGVRQRMQQHAEAIKHFQASIQLGKKLNDQKHLAMVYTHLGKALRSQGKLEAAQAALQQGFGRDAKLKNKRGLGIVTPSLIEVLVLLQRHTEAQQIYQRAIAIAPHNKAILNLQALLNKAQHKAFTGTIKYLSDAKHKPGKRFGFIKCDNGDADVYFYEPHLRPEDPTVLQIGISVSGVAKQGEKGWAAMLLEVSKLKHER